MTYGTESYPSVAVAYTGTPVAGGLNIVANITGVNVRALMPAGTGLPAGCSFSA